MPRPLRSLFVCTLVLPLALAQLACGPGAAKPPSGPTRPHSGWTGVEADLFDDGIDTGAIPLGNATISRDEINEQKIPARIANGDGVVLAKVIGVTSEPVGDKKRYRIELSVEGEALAGTRIDSPFVLLVEPSAPAFGTVRSQDAQLIGRKLVVFYRRYAADDGGEPITHYHLSPATQAVFDAIKKSPPS